MTPPRPLVLFGLLVLCPLLVVGCNRKAAERGPRTTVLLFERDATQADVRAEFLAWTEDAVNRPGSTILLCAPAQDGSGRCAPRIAVPAWRSSVLRAKAAFRRSAPDLLDAAFRTRSTWGPPPPHLGKGAAVLFVGTPASGAWTRHLATAGGPPLHVLVLVDVSPSAGADACDGADLRAEFDAFLSRGGLASGSSFTVKRIGRDLATMTEVHHVELSDADAALRGLRALAARQQFERLDLRDPSAGSAIAEAVYRACTELQHSKGDLQLVLRSDLQQSSRTLGSFEHHVPSSAEFIAALRREHLAAALERVQIEVCGTHFQAAEGRPISARTDAAIKATWQETWTAFGARSVHFSTRCEGQSSSQSSPGGT